MEWSMESKSSVAIDEDSLTGFCLKSSTPSEEEKKRNNMNHHEKLKFSSSSPPRLRYLLADRENVSSWASNSNADVIKIKKKENWDRKTKSCKYSCFYIKKKVFFSVVNRHVFAFVSSFTASKSERNHMSGSFTHSLWWAGNNLSLFLRLAGEIWGLEDGKQNNDPVVVRDGEFYFSFSLSFV